MMVIGVDPGVTGAIAFLDDAAQPLKRRLVVHDMPAAKTGVGVKRAEILEAALAQLVKREIADHLAAGHKFLAAVEKVGAMPGQGVSSMFAFGQSYGVIRGVLAALELPVVLLSPKEWQGQLGIRFNHANKRDISRANATRMFPQEAGYFVRKGDHNRADATLIAEAARRLSSSA